MSQQNLDLRKSIQIVRRRKRLFGGVVALGLLVGAAYAVLTPPLISSTALVVVSSVPAPLTNQANTSGDAAADDQPRDSNSDREQRPRARGRTAESQPAHELAAGAGRQDLRRGPGWQRRPVDYRDRKDRRPGGEHRQRGREQLCHLRDHLDQPRRARGGQDGRAGDNCDRGQAARAHRHIRHLGRTRRSARRFRHLLGAQPK